MKKFTKDDASDLLNINQLEVLATVDPWFVIDHLENETIFDSQLARVLFELGIVKAQELLAEYESNSK